MIYNIFGFRQEKLVEFGLGTSDALILRYLVDFIKSKKMVEIVYDKETYYWLDYKFLIENMPILGLKKQALARRLKEMVNTGVLKHYTKREGGVYSFYALGYRYKELENDTKHYVSKGGTLDGSDIEPSVSKEEAPSDENIEPYVQKGATKDYSIKDYTINNNSNKYNNSYVGKKREKRLSFNNFEGRSYDYDRLEKALLGWDEN